MTLESDGWRLNRGRRPASDPLYVDAILYATPGIIYSKVSVGDIEGRSASMLLKDWKLGRPDSIMLWRIHGN